MGWLTQDMNEADQVRQMGEMYQVCNNKLQVLLSTTATLPKRWVDVLLLMARAQFLADMHDSLGHCRQDKLLSALCSYYWWPGIHADIANCVWH